MISDQQVCREVAAELRRCGAHHLPVNNGSAIFAACALERIATRLDHYERKMFTDEYDSGAEAELSMLTSTVGWVKDDLPTPDRSGEADKTGTGLAGGESGLPEGSSKP